MQPSLFGPITPKLWGHEVLLTNTPQYCGKFLVLAGGYQCSLHRHHIKDETFFVLEGEVTIDYIDPISGGIEVQKLGVGDQFHVPPGMYHRFGSVGPALLLEISTPHKDSDVSRLVDSCPLADQ